MSKLFQCNRLKCLKLGGLNCPIQSSIICYFQVKVKIKKPDKQNKTKRKKTRTVIDILCKSKQKRECNTKISY